MKKLVLSAMVVALASGSAFAQNTDPLKDMQEKAKQKAAEAQKQAEKAAQDAVKKAQDAAGMGQMDPAKMLEEYAKASAPREEHKLMAAMIGTWDATVTAWMDPSAPPMTSTGTMVNTAVFGGRFIREDWKGEFMGQQFEGLGYMGFNNATGKFEGTWMDSMGTAIYHSTGEKSADGKTITMYGTETDPMTKETMKTKDVVAFEGPDAHSMTRFYVKDGQELKGLEIKYTRKK